MNRSFLTSENKNLSLLYDKYKEFFMKFATKNFSIGSAVLEDLYQESFISLHEVIQKGKFPASVSYRTYLFAIGKNKIRNYLRDHNPDLVGISEDILQENHFYESEEWQRKQEIVYREVCRMKEPCNRILSLFYYDEKSMKEIAGQMGYKNEQVAKNRKYLCLKKLKDLITGRLKEEDLI